MSVKYFDLYLLNFNYLNNFFAKMWTVQNAKFNASFLEAKLGSFLLDDYARNEKIIALVEKLNLGASKEHLEDMKTCNTNITNLLSSFGGSDSFKIQELVNNILGISQNEDIHFLPGERREYLQLMCKSGFLSGKGCFFIPNVKEEGLYKYHPELLAAKFLKENPHIKTLTIGCGKNVHTRPGSCLFRRAEDHAHAALRIDISAMMGPDVVVDMHHPDFWKVISEHYFENIEDHTYGYFLLDNPSSPQTIREVFRTLKPGGWLLFDLPLKEEHIVLLKEAGFSIEGEEPTKVQRPL
jgi:SAM-dependent methyltransferase